MTDTMGFAHLGDRPASGTAPWSRIRLALVPAILLAASTHGLSAEHRVRPTWGNEALWGYWTFENDYVPKGGWKILAVSQEGAGNWGARNLIDGDPETFYYPNGKDSYEVTIDLGQSRELGAFTVLTLGRPNEAHDSRMARYELRVGEVAEEKGKLVAEGPFDGAPGEETTVAFPAARGRYLTLTAFSRPNANKEVCLRELSLVEAGPATRHLAERQAAPAEAKARWRDRNSDQAVERLAREFLDLIFVTQDEIYRVSNLTNREKLLAIGKLRAAGKSAEALKVFRNYYWGFANRSSAALS